MSAKRREIQKRLAEQRDTEEFERMLRELSLHDPDPQHVRDRAKADFLERFVIARIQTGNVERLTLSGMGSIWGEASIAWNAIEACRYGVDVNAWREGKE
jgi:hypothetical protein